jgi:DNA-binding transcriptional regulator YiaG
VVAQNFLLRRDNNMTVFLCHAKEDKAEVHRLNKSLQNAGFQTWLDKERLLPGDDWQAEIEKAIRSAAAIVVCLSSTSVSKTGYVQKELRFALDTALYMPPASVFLIPCVLCEVKLPESLGHLHAVDLRQPGSVERVVVALKRRYLALEERGVFASDAPKHAVLPRDASDAPTKGEGTRSPGNPKVSAPDVRAIRAQLNLSQAEFAERFGFSVATVQRWEQARSMPSEPARIFLQLIAAKPDAVQAEIARLKGGGADIWSS